MAKFHNPKYSKKEVSQKFNLKEILGYSPSDEQKELFFELAVERQQQRTTSGKDINGSDFQPYTKEYADQKGVTRDSVDLLDKGTMLSSFEESNNTLKQKNMLKIKMEEGKETLKAYNHNVGDTTKKRTFFGIIKDKEIEQIKKEVDKLKPKREPRRPKRAEQDEPDTITNSVTDLAELRAAVNELDIEFDFGDFNGNS